MDHIIRLSADRQRRTVIVKLQERAVKTPRAIEATRKELYLIEISGHS